MFLLACIWYGMQAVGYQPELTASCSLSFHRPQVRCLPLSRVRASTESASQVAPFTVVALLMYASDRIVRGLSMVYYSLFKPSVVPLPRVDAFREALTPHLCLPITLNPTGTL